MTRMIEVQVAELIGPALRYAVAIACGFKVKRLEEGDYKPGEPHWWMAYDERRVTPTRNGLVGYIKPGAEGVTSGYDYCPDVDWQIGGPLIIKYKPWLSPPVVDVLEDQPVGWDAEIYDEAGNEVIGHAIGCPTALVAVCRAVVLAKLGDVVSVPTELVQGGAE